jgi:hypothetical protein
MSYDGPIFHEDWLERTALIASMILPNSRVVEFGAGLKYLKTYLPEGCSYIGYDLEDFDLTDEVWPEIPDHDVAVFAGVWEWLERPEKIVERMTAPIMIFSYQLAGYDSLHTERRKSGWKCMYGLESISYMLRDNDYWPSDQREWRGQIVWRCYSYTRKVKQRGW